MSTNATLDDLVIRSSAASNNLTSVPIFRIQQKTALVTRGSVTGSDRDAFGRSRISNPVTLFESSMEVDDQPLLWVESVTGSGAAAYNANQGSVTLSTGAASSTSIRQSRQYARYQPGKSLLCYFSFVLGDAAVGVTRRVGYYDDDNGVFLEQDGGLLEVSTLDTTGGTFTTGTYFLLYSVAGTKYYVWLDVNGDGVTDDPLPTGIAPGTSVAADISGGASEAQVATAVASAVNALADFSATPSTNVVTITHATAGTSTDITNVSLVGWADAGTVTTQGVAESLAWVVRSNVTGSPVDTRVLQANWDIDTLDGSGVSALTLDDTEAQIGVIDLEWLGVGRVRTGFIVNGELYYTHGFENLGSTVVYMSRGSLPVRYEIDAGATGSDQDLVQICSTVISEGGYIPRGMIRAGGSGKTATSISGDDTPIVAIRLTSTYNRGQLVPLAMNFLITSAAANAVYLYVVVGATSVTGGSWSAASEAAEINTTMTAVTGGYIVAEAFADAKEGAVAIGGLDNTSLVNVSNFAGTADIIAVIGTPISGTPTVVASLQWRELF